MRVILFGSYTPGVSVLECLLDAEVDVVAVGTHWSEPEDDAWVSLYEQAVQRGLNVMRFDRHTRHEIGSFVRESRADLGLTIGFRYLLDEEVIGIPPGGWLNFHSSLLPQYRGRAPLNWAIINGEKELGVSLHRIDEGTDTGDIVFQERFTLTESEDVGDALDKLYPLYQSLALKAVDGYRAGDLPQTPQDHPMATVFPRRTPEDGRIDWNWPATQAVNFVRGLTHPYPGAYTYLNGKRLQIWKAKVGDTTSPAGKPGSVLTDGGINCNPGILVATDAQWAESDGSQADIAASAPCVLGD